MTRGDEIPQSPARASATQSNATSGGAIRSEALLQGKREALILHAGEVYRLRLTKNGKLLLTK